MLLKADGRCQSCGASIHWGTTDRGRKIPVDRVPVADGNLVVVEGRFVVYLPLLHAEGPRYISHFATCLHAAEHRSGRR